MFSGRIMAIRGNYNEIMAGVKDHDEEMVRLLDNEVASLFVPAETNQNCVLKIRHLANRELYLNQVDAPREFVLKVVETICGGNEFIARIGNIVTQYSLIYKTAQNIMIAYKRLLRS